MTGTGKYDPAKRADAVDRIAGWFGSVSDGPTDDEVLDHRVRWIPDRWRHPELDPWVESVVERVTDVSTVSGRWHLISRRATFDIADDGPHSAFVAAMIFGFGDRGYGPQRTAWMLQTTDATTKIGQAATELARSIDNAHRYMINRPGRLAWCRTPFISKYLYFAGYDNETRPRPLIFDQVVQGHLADRCAVNLRLHYTDDYVEYCQLLHAVADRMDVRPDLVELALFRGS